MKSETIYIFGLTCLVAFGEAAMKSYKGYKVLSVVPTTSKSQKFLLNLMLTDSQVDFWTEPSGLGRKVGIMVGPSYLTSLKKKLTKENISYNISINNVQEHLKPSLERHRFVKANGAGTFNINDFNTLENIFSWLRSLSNSCPPGINCNLYHIGNSFEANPIYVFKISTAPPGIARKAYWIDATIHPREWLSTATILKILLQFVTQGDQHAIELVHKYDWYFAPMLNPDGYAYTWTTDRIWRKNRSPNAFKGCYGTDLNRNFNFRWGKEGVSRDPCMLTYCGPSAGSELETKAVSAELNRLGASIAAVVSLHSHAKMFLTPWGNTVNSAGKICERTEDHDKLMRVADLTADAIQKTYNTQWERGTACEVLYGLTGHLADYARGVSGIKYSFSAELRGDDFEIPADQIPLSYREFYNGIVAMVKATQS